MKRLLLVLAALAPMAAAAQGLLLRPPSLGDALHTVDQLENRGSRGLDQTFVLPERAGQNQVAWYRFEWQYIDVPAPGGVKGGIRLYYYRNEIQQARRALPAILSAYARLVDQFHYSPTKRIPYILYATQREFQTTNVFQVNESVLGVTSPEDLKMTVPYFGDHQKFVEVSTHEMVHQFQIQKMRDEAGSGDPTAAMNALPLWFTEGIAEYYSKGGIDSETDLFLRDLVWNPDHEKHYDVVSFAEDRVRGYIPTYKLGQVRIAFIADVYGKEKIQAFIENAYLLAEGDTKSASPVRNFAALVRRVLNEPLEQVDARWRTWLKRRYYPEYIRAQQDLPQLREIRGLPNEPESFSASPDGNLVVARTIDRERGRARLVLFDLRNPRGAVEIAADGQPGFESLHPIEYGIAAVAPGVVVFSAQDGIGDRVYVQPFKVSSPEGRPPRISLGHRRALDVRPPDGGRFIQVADPAISPDGKEFAFVGAATGDGRQDIYVAPMAGGVARRVTNDPYAEKDLAWGANGIYTASDATDHGRTNLFRIDPRTGERTRLTTAPTTDRHPAPQPDGSVLFTSDAHGKLDVYSLKDGRIQQVTDFTTGLTSPALAPKGRGVLATTFYGGVFKLVEVPKTGWLETASTAVPPAAGDVLQIPESGFPTDEASDYDAFSLKNWRPEAGFVYGGGAGSAVAGRAAVLFDDMLRDHVVFVDLAVLGSFDYTQGLVLYENRARRLGWTLGAFHFVQQNIDQKDENLAYYQRDFGVVGALRYPLDRFRRFEVELTAGGTQRYCLQDFTTTDVNVALNLQCTGIQNSNLIYHTTGDWRASNDGVNLSFSPAVRYGYDSIRYDIYTGPLAGQSLVTELGGIVLPGREALSGFARVDAQQYFQLGKRANLGLRAAVGTSFAPNPRSEVWQRTWWLSSADNLRGFYWSDIENLIGKNYYVANAELQIPLDSLVHLVIFDYVEGVAALDFGGVFDRFTTGRSSVLGPNGEALPPRRQDLGAWDVRTLTGVLGVNVLFGPLLLRVHFGHPFNIGGLETRDVLRYGVDTSTSTPSLVPVTARAMQEGRWVTNVTLRYFFF